MNSAKRKQLKLKARRELCQDMAVEVFGWSVVILGAAVTAKFMYVCASLYNVILINGSLYNVYVIRC